MSKQSAADILKNYGQRITEKRVALLEILLRGDAKAFALSDIEKQLTVSMDRVTVYRTLQTFEETGLVIKMVDHKGTCLYMLNLEDHNKLSAHPHLHCTACGEIVCLPSLPEAYLKKLEDYQIDEIYFLMEGKCRACSTE